MIAALVGAFFPAIPKIGLVGTVIAGQWPLHLLAFAATEALVGAGLRRWGLPRFGRALAAVGTAGCVACAVIAGTQITFAIRAGTDISLTEPFRQLGYPATRPDQTMAYATVGGETLLVDAYLPASTDGHRTPAIVLAHAGGYHVFDRTDLRGTGRWLADHGVAVFAVDYRLATPTRPTWDKAPQDLVCALGWVRQHATQFAIDPDSVSLGGMSAGGVLALDAAYRLAQSAIESSCGDTTTPPATVVGFYAGFDVTAHWDAGVLGQRNATELLTGGTPKEFPDRYRAVSPASYLTGDLMPTLLVVGDRDHSVPPESNRAFAQRLTEHGVPNRLEILPFADHAFDDAYGSFPAQTSRQILLDFLRPT